MILNCVSSIKQSWRPSDFLAPCDCIILHHRPHRCGLILVLSTSLYSETPAHPRPSEAGEGGCCIRGAACARARCPHGHGLRASQPEGRGHRCFHCMLSAWTRGPWHASVSQIYFHPVVRVRASGFLSCVEAVPPAFRFRLLLCVVTFRPADVLV